MEKLQTTKRKRKPCNSTVETFDLHMILKDFSRMYISHWIFISILHVFEKSLEGKL